MKLSYEPFVAKSALLTLLSWAFLACGGKGVAGSCPDGTTCGGSPVGTWHTVGSCEFAAERSDQPLTPSEQVRLPILPLLTASPIPATTVGDQCSQLIYGPSDMLSTTPNTKIRAVNLWHSAPPLTGGQVTVNADASFSIALKFGVREDSHFSPYCLQAAGANPSCTDLAANLSQYYLGAASMDAAGTPLTDYANIACQQASDGGCDCGYDYQVLLNDAGTWAAAGSVMSMSSDPSAYTLNGKPGGSQAPTGSMVSSICQQGSSLTLSGYAGAPLFHAAGLRVLTLQSP